MQIILYYTTIRVYSYRNTMFYYQLVYRIWEMDMERKNVSCCRCGVGNDDDVREKCCDETD